MSALLDDLIPFPDGLWLVEIVGIKSPLGFEGSDLYPAAEGLYMTHRPATENDSQEIRHSFVPWHRVIRAYTVREP